MIEITTFLWTGAICFATITTCVYLHTIEKKLDVIIKLLRKEE